MKEDPFVRGTSDSFSNESTQHLPADVLEEIEKAIGEVLSPDIQTSSREEHVVEETDGIEINLGTQQMQETFLEIAKEALNPVERYVKALSLGEDSREILELCELVVDPLIPKVEAVGLSEHAEELKFFQSLLLLALGEKDPSGAQAMKEVVMEGFIRLSECFELDYRGYRLAVRNLVDFYRSLRSTDGISETDIRRFFAIGVPSLTWVRRTRPSELASLCGIDEQVVNQIHQLAFLYQSGAPKKSSRLARQRLKNEKTRLYRRTNSFHEILIDEVRDASVDDVHMDFGIRGQA